MCVLVLVSALFVPFVFPFLYCSCVCFRLQTFVIPPNLGDSVPSPQAHLICLCKEVINGVEGNGVSNVAHNITKDCENSGKLEEGKPSYKTMLSAEEERVECPPSAVFNGGIVALGGVGTKGLLGASRDKLRDGGSITTGDPRGEENGKDSPSTVKVLSLTPNDEMLKAIRNEQNILKNVVVFFICMDHNALPSRKFFND